MKCKQCGLEKLVTEYGTACLDCCLKSSPKGYYLVNKNIQPLVALAYICCDGDPGFTLEEARRLQKEDPDMIIVNRKGEKQ